MIFRGVFLLMTIMISSFQVRLAAVSDMPDPGSFGQIESRQLKAEFLLRIGSDNRNEDFFSPKDFTIGRDGTIYILDSGNSRVQCFSPQGKFVYSFGRFGQGPGELSKEASKIKILEDGNIYIIDNMYRRISVYDHKGSLVRTYKMKTVFDDIVLRNNTYYLSNFILRENYKPIFFANDLGHVNDSFGKIIEPSMNILRSIKDVPDSRLIENEFAYRNMTSLLVGSDENIIYSQLYPYHLIKFSKDGRIVKKIIGDPGFDTHFPFEITFKGSSITRRVLGPVPVVYAPLTDGDGHIIVPIISPDRSYFVFDIYDTYLSLLERYKIPNVFYDFKKVSGITNIYIDNEFNFYGLVISREDIPMLMKYRLIRG